MICIISNLSHSQRQIECGFSVSKSLLVENMHERSICAQQLVSDFMKSLNKEFHKNEIENELMFSCRAAQ